MTPPNALPPQPSDISARAHQVVQDLLRRLNISGTVSVRDRLQEHPPHLWIEITTRESGILIGEHGTHLRALEYVVRLLLRTDLEEASCRCFLDVNGYRLRRMEFLKKLARDAARRVAASQHAVTLDPMPAVERRIVHLALTGEAMVETGSVGSGADRRVVIRPRDPFLTPESVAHTAEAQNIREQ